MNPDSDHAKQALTAMAHLGAPFAQEYLEAFNNPDHESRQSHLNNIHSSVAMYLKNMPQPKSKGSSQPANIR